MRTPLSRRSALIALAAVTTGTLVACGPRADDTARPLRAVPAELVAPTTTTSTTTTTTPENQSDEPIATETVLLYFILGDAITTVVRNVPVDPEPQDVLDSLLRGFPSSSIGLDVRSAIPRDLVASVTVERGLATVDTDGSLLSEISPIDQPLAIAQIVLTLTSRPGIGQVAFLVNGEPQAVPRGGGELAPADEPVAYDDYAMLLSKALIDTRDRANGQ